MTQGFDAVQVGEEIYWDPQATDNDYPGALGLEIRKKTYWQGDEEFYVYETVGPKFGPKWPEGTMKVSGLGMDTDVWGMSDKDPPPPGYDPWLQAGLPGGTEEAGGTNAGTNILTANPLSQGGSPYTYLVPKHEWTPCFEDDGVTPTMGGLGQRHWIDITLLGAYGGDIRFPVMPEEFGADFTHEYWTPKVVGLGEIIMPGGQSMETISWDSFFPGQYDSDYCVISPLELEDPKSLTARLIWTMRFKMDCMLLVGGGIWNDRVVITNFNYRHRAGEIFDIYYTITLKRYRAPIVTTSVNPDASRDRWYKDPRRPGAAEGEGIGPELGAPPTGNLDQDFPPGSLPDAGANPNQVELVPVPPDTVPDLGLRPPSGTRDGLITIETGKVLGQPAKDIRQPGGPSAAFSETFTQVVARLSKEGPNDMAGMLALNQWVSDNNYNPYTSQLPVGSGVRYYKESPVGAGTATSLSPVGAVVTAGAIGDAVSVVSEAAAKAWEQANNALRPPDWFTKPIVDWDLNYRPDPSTVTPGVPVNVPRETPRQGGIRR